MCLVAVKLCMWSYFAHLCCIPCYKLHALLNWFLDMCHYVHSVLCSTVLPVPNNFLNGQKTVGPTVSVALPFDNGNYIGVVNHTIFPSLTE